MKVFHTDRVSESDFNTILAILGDGGVIGFPTDTAYGLGADPFNEAAIDRMRDRPDSTPLLEHINVPTLVVVGEEDNLTPVAESEKMHAAIPRSVLTRIPGAGHLSSLEDPETFNSLLAAFLKSQVT